MLKRNSAFFNNLKIGHRLTLGFSILIVLTLLVGAVSFAATSAQTQSLERTLAVHNAADQVLSMNLQLTQAQEFTDDFLLHWRVEGFQQAYDNYVIANQQQTQAIRDTIARARLIEDEEEILDLLDDVEQTTLNYDTLLILLTSRIEQRGHVDTGLEGQLREVAQALEASSVVASNPELLVSLLQMRRNEKDYLLRGLQEDVNTTVRFTIQFQNQIRALPISPEQQQELISLSNDYLVGFMQLAGLDRQIAIDTETLHTHVQSILPLLEIIVADEEEEADENLASLRVTGQLAQVFSTSLLVLATFAGIVLAFIIRRSITRPLAEMTSVAAALSAGDLNRRANVITGDEIGVLAQTFNAMAQQIQEVVSSLESRVAARTTDLAITVEVGSLAMSIRNQEELLPKIVEFIRARFGLYYTQIYLLDEARRFAHLRAGTGKVGEQLLARNHRLDMDDISLVATAVRTGEPVLVNDTETSTLHKKNPLLPDTRSEISIPLVVGDDILGVLDMQAVNTGTFNQDNIGVFQAMANQLASALRSAQAYEEARQAIDRTEAINRRLTSTTWQPYLERLAVGRPVGYEYNLETPRPLESGIQLLNGANAAALTHAIALRGQSIGKVVVQDEEDREWTAEELALVASVTERVALALEQFRAFDETKAALGQTEALYTASERLNQAATAAEVLQALVDSTFLRKLDQAGLSLFNRPWVGDDRPETLLTAAQWLRSGGESSLPVGTVFPVEYFPMLTLIGRNTPFIVGDTLTDPRLDENARALLQQIDGRSLLLFPLTLGDEWLGILSGQATEPRSFADDDVRQINNLTGQAATIIQNLRLFEETEAAREDANTLYEIGVLISEAADEQQIVDAFVKHMVGPEIASVSMNVWENGDFDTATTFVIPAGWWRDPELEFRGVTMQMSHFPFTSLIDRHDLTAFDNVNEDPRIDEQSRQALAMFKTGAFVLVPFTIGERFIGTMAISSHEPRVHSERELRMLRSLADPIATAIERLRLNRQTEKRAAEMETVAMVSSAVTTLMDVDALLEAVANLTKDSFDLYHAHVYLLDGDELVMAGGAGEAGRIMKEQRRSIALNHPHSLVGNTGRTQLGVIANDVTQNPDFLPHPLLPDTKSEMAIPLLVGDELIGVLDVQASVINRFTDDDVQVMSSLAAQIAIAVQNARAFDETKAAQQLAAQERNILRTLIDSIPDAIYIKDAQARFITCNARQASLIIKASGSISSLEEIVGKTDLDLFPENGAQYYADELAILASGAPMLSKEEPIIGLDGSPGWHLTSKLPVRDTRGSIVGLVGIGIDITERKRQEETLRENEAQLAEAQRIARLGRWSWNLATNDIIWNDQMFEINGISPDTAMNFDVFSSTLHPEDAPGLMGGIEGLLQAGDQHRWPEYRIIRPTGEIRYLTATGTVKRDAQGKPYEMVGVVQDITEAKRVEEERRILFEAASKLNDARSPHNVMEAVNNYARSMGCISATLMYVDSDKNNRAEWATVVANWTAEGNIATEVGTRFYLPEFPFARLWTSNPDKPTLIDDIATNPLVDEATRGQMLQLGIRGLALLPLYTQGRWVALMSFNWGEEAAFAERDIRIFTSMAQQATSVVEAMRSSALTRKRALELATVAQVSAAATTILDVEPLLQQVSDLTKLSFNLYHVHVYLLENNNLVLTAGAGEVGRSMKAQGRSISFSQANSLVARAARERKGVIVNDVTQNPDFLPHPLLPDTKSEMAIPMLVGEQLIGVLDVQGNDVNRFSDEDMQIMSTLSAQVAVAVRNARAFELERQTAERLREVDRLKSQFLANMSHELRTPLNSIIGYSEVLLDGGDGDLTEEAVEDVETIHGSGQHLLAIINDILDLAKIEAGQMQINRQDADLVSFLTEIVHAGQILVKDKPVALTLAEEAELPHLHADPIRLRQIVWNLVSNAVKFTEKGHVTVTVGLLDEKQAYVKVTDSGIGIKPEDVGVVFDQFRQVDGSSTRRAGGTGLGLTITRHLVRLHGGEIYVESEFGVGSTFWFTLPLYTRVNN